MEEERKQGGPAQQSVTIEGDLYELGNGNVIRVYSTCDDPECEYGYDYLDGHTKRLIDGGVFDLDDAGDGEEVLKEALRCCDLDPEETTWSLIGEDVEYYDLEEMGYTGF